MFEEVDVFHLGNDGIIHFTETHKNNRYDDFCIDMSTDLDEDVAYDNTKTYEGDYSNSDYQYDESYISEKEYAYDDGSNKSACSNIGTDDRLHTMVAMFCDFDFAYLPKCCDRNENLNLRYIFTDDE